MRKALAVVAVALLLVVLSLSTNTFASSRQPPKAVSHGTASKALQTWSYKVAHVDNYEMEKGLDVLGNDGWEMVAPLKPNSYSYQGAEHEGYIFIFKKPRG